MKQNSKYLKALLDSTSFICYVCFALQYQAPDNHRNEQCLHVENRKEKKWHIETSFAENNTEL